MKADPIKKIRHIEVDDDSGTDWVKVHLHVPGFQNFGQRMGELESQAWEAEGFGEFERTQGVPESERKDFNYRLDDLRVELPEGVEWNKTAEAAVDRFLADWPELRPAVLQATFEYYKRIHSDAISYRRDNPGVKFILPESNDPQVVADLFRVTAIYLHDDDALGLSGPCTWDQEHLWGVLLRKNKVVSVGGWDEGWNG